MLSGKSLDRAVGERRHVSGNRVRDTVYSSRLTSNAGIRWWRCARDDRLRVVSEAEDDPKAKFREALERKKSKQHPHEAASQNDAKAHEARTAAGGKRQFRRKSG